MLSAGVVDAAVDSAGALVAADIGVTDTTRHGARWEHAASIVMTNTAIRSFIGRMVASGIRTPPPAIGNTLLESELLENALEPRARPYRFVQIGAEGLSLEKLRMSHGRHFHSSKRGRSVS